MESNEKFIKLKRVFGGKYHISHVGSKDNSIDFIKVVVYNDKVHYNFLSSKWEIKEEYLDEFCLKNSAIMTCDNTLDKIKRYDKSNESIGKMMKLQPYEYQKESISFIINNNSALLVLPCGSGKTITGIGAYLECKDRGIFTGKGLIVVKASLKYQWHSEVFKFSDLNATIIETPSSIASYQKSKIGKIKKQIKELDKIEDREQIKSLRKDIKELEEKVNDKFNEQFADDVDLYIANYEALLDDTIRNKLHKMKLGYIFADEVHMIGSPKSQRSKALHEFEANVKVGATATPITNNPENIYSIFKFIQPDLFPSWNKFSAMFVKWAGRGRISGVRNQDKLTAMIKPFIMIKSKEEISDQLPKLRVIQRFLTLTDEQYEMHNTIIEQLDVLKERDFALRSKCKTDFEANNNPELQKIGAQILALQTFSQEIADAPELLEASDSEFAKKYIVNTNKNPKLDLLLDIMEEILDSGEKLAIFSKFTEMQTIITKAINKRFKKAKVAYVNGSISSKQRAIEVYDKFRDNDEYKVLIMSDAGAEGLNLSKCKYLIEYDIANSYAIQTQRHGRLERADSIHDNVIVYQLIARDSWDEIALKIVEKKENYDLEIIKSTID